ncbi:hypothetical protein QE152_g30552 [Popillia japonica]|uniref:Uncharacterized protein n=1 Tax=Popillia japonica TaxID=7064 RepID=A0AAW1JDX9_POPJA
MVSDTSFGLGLVSDTSFGLGPGHHHGSWRGEIATPYVHLDGKSYGSFAGRVYRTPGGFQPSPPETAGRRKGVEADSSAIGLDCRPLVRISGLVLMVLFPDSSAIGLDCRPLVLLRRCC